MNLSGITSSSINVISHPPVFDFPIDINNNTPLGRKFIGNPLTNSASEAEQLVSQLDQLFGYHKSLNTEQEKRVNSLFNQIDKILQNSPAKGASEKQQAQLDKLFNEVDYVYQARSYESLTSKEHKIVDRLLGQLDAALA